MRASRTPRWRRSWPTRAARRRSGARTRVPDLLNLHDVYRALLQARATSAARSTSRPTETQIICDENGRIEKIVPRTRNEAHRLIEEAMLAANVCSADFIAAEQAPRACTACTKGPTPEKKEILRGYLKAMGVGPDDQRRPQAAASSRRSPKRPRSGPTRSRSTRCCCARCSRRSTRRSTAATSAWPTRPTRTSRARSGVIRICWCTA